MRLNKLNATISLAINSEENPFPLIPRCPMSKITILVSFWRNESTAKVWVGFSRCMVYQNIAVPIVPNYQEIKIILVRKSTTFLFCYHFAILSSPLIPGN